MSLRERAKNFRLWTYRHPYAWTAAKRAAVVAPVVGALALGGRRAARLGEKAVMQAHRLHNERMAASHAFQYDPSASLFQRGQRLRRALRRTRVQGAASRLRAHRLYTAATVGGAAGGSWALMPMAIQAGSRRNLERQRQAATPVVVLHRRGGRIVQRRFL